MMMAECRHSRSLFRDERSFTTTSMVLSLLITLALVFTSAQVYRISSASAEVQDVADAAVLAAENQVAEFMVIARFCDAVVLSMSLVGIATCGLGIAALCTPATAALSSALLDTSAKIIEARDKFADRAEEVLGKLQEALPYLAAACAAGVCAANDDDSAGSDYIGVALLVPGKGDEVEVDSEDGAGELVDDVEQSADEIREKAKEAEEATKAANEAKQRAFSRDCGDNPGYCMYERAGRLAGLSGSSNPLYSSIDTWSFSVALERAKRYYSSRAENDEPEGNAPGDIARWRLRLDFYEYAADLLEREGYVHETDDDFDACFPHLPKNTSEMRETGLFTQKVYPITEEPADDGGDPMPVMHAWAGCPGATGEVTMHESIAYMESTNLSTCPVCEFTAASMGKVAAASTSIENGFEYHYEAVAREAETYQKERESADGPKAEVKEAAGGLFDKLTEALKEAVGRRIEVSPPGTFGSVAIVVNAGSTPASEGFASGFVVSSGSLGPRAAISASTLLDEGSDEGRNVINSLLDGLKQDGGAAVGAAGIVLDVWSRMLLVYSNGMDSLTEGIEAGLNQMPLVGASGLGSWASGSLRSAFEGVGLQPAKLEALKPVLVNSAHVAAKGNETFAEGLLSMKQRVIAHPMDSTDLFNGLITDAEAVALERIEELGDSVEIASIELLGDAGPSIPITIPLPAQAKQFGIDAVRRAFDELRAMRAETMEVRPWE